ncbi:P-loop NTPase fold protein [Pseudovibrio sp. Tun.PSC04-5.I4]|uniref:KAP family P-loop NTPase fold protein n=1 Tax=Pseudovibrio sp. Tun.PSC04-5.I4 TaxID=1798213 RepID=UPI00088AB4A2|nr:P-loop NTPase fold protein [Pseudovibrio sp. Tun.PSC04-5.I4]SDR35671.1 KAP family P-loop domain-containing protein [Pseudovibrio sp. Tun.PSC04-5.I4]
MTDIPVLDKILDTSNVWGDDLLGRANDAEFLEVFLLGQTKHNKGSFVLNIDSSWGVGKTFFLKRFKQQLEISGQQVAFVNAWEDDHTDDPLVAVMSEIQRTIEEDESFSDEAKRSFKNTLSSMGKLSFSFVKAAAKHQLKKHIGEAIDTFDTEEESAFDKGGDELINGLENFAAASLENFKSNQSAISSFKKQLAAAITQDKDGKTQPFFVFIDELDRCRPTYAIELLERIKHLFDIEGLIFVLATDTGQLAESVKAVYGSGFDGKRYLQRFFDQTYKFEPPKLRASVDAALAATSFNTSALLSLDGVELGEIITNGLEAYQVSTREALRAIDLLKICTQAWPHQDIQIVTFVILPMIVAHLKGEQIPKSEDDLKDHPVLTFTDKSHYEWILTSPNNFENTISAHQMIEQFFNAARDISNIQAPPSNKERHWSSLPKFNLRRECQKRFPHGLTQGQKVPSYILDYPALIRSAGRLVPK